jgi:hypothetical protein
LFNQTIPASKPQNQSLPTIYRATHALVHAGLLTFLWLWPSPPPAQASASERGGAQTPQESISLEPGKPIERELSGGLSHFYKMAKHSGGDPQ